MIYLDNSATTKPCGEAVAAVAKAMTENWGWNIFALDL